MSWLKELSQEILVRKIFRYKPEILLRPDRTEELKSLTKWQLLRLLHFFNDESLGWDWSDELNIFRRTRGLYNAATLYKAATLYRSPANNIVVRSEIGHECNQCLCDTFHEAITMLVSLPL